jgi:hypothetical protein
MFTIIQYLVGGNNILYCFRRVTINKSVYLGDDMKCSNVLYVDRHNTITKVNI